eukprot:symbB.v1.2.021323.t1/scaffold1838.1/size108694/3
MVFFRCWSLVLLMAAAAAVREESKLSVDLSTDEYMEEELDMKLVPARISKAIRRTMRLSKEAIEKAAEKEANMTAQKEAAAAKKAEAQQKSLESEQAMAEANKKREDADKKQNAALEAIGGKEAAAKTFNEGAAELKGLTDKVDEMSKQHKKLVDDISKEGCFDAGCQLLNAHFVQEMQALAEKKLLSFEGLEAAKSAKMIQQTKVNELEKELGSKASDLQEAIESAEAAKVEVIEAEKLEAAAEEAANDAQEEFENANVRLEHANKTFILAKKEKDRKVAVAKLIKEVRDSVQTFYDAMDKSSKSMEKLYEESEGKPDAKPAHENLRTNPDVKEALIAYNEMVLSFRDLHVTSKDFYTYVADSVGEIQQNAEASIQLQCDPTEELERKAKETKDLDEWHKNCGKGVWKDLKLQQQRFPHLEKNKVKEDTVVNESP